MADPSDFWFWLLMLGVAVLGGGWLAFRFLHVARMLEDTPTSRVRSAAQGYVELVGRSQALACTTKIAPLTQRPSVWWRFRIQRRTGSNTRGNRRTTKDDVALIEEPKKQAPVPGRDVRLTVDAELLATAKRAFGGQE